MITNPNLKAAQGKYTSAAAHPMDHFETRMRFSRTVARETLLRFRAEEMIEKRGLFRWLEYSRPRLLTIDPGLMVYPARVV